MNQATLCLRLTGLRASPVHRSSKSVGGKQRGINQAFLSAVAPIHWSEGGLKMGFAVGFVTMLRSSGIKENGASRLRAETHFGVQARVNHVLNSLPRREERPYRGSGVYWGSKCNEVFFWSGQTQNSTIPFGQSCAVNFMVLFRETAEFIPRI